MDDRYKKPYARKDRPKPDYSDYDAVAVGVRLAKLLEDNRISQADLINATDLNKNTISACCNANYKNPKSPNMKTIHRIVQGLNWLGVKVNLNDLFGEPDPKDEIIRRYEEWHNSVLDLANKVNEHRHTHILSDYSPNPINGNKMLCLRVRSTFDYRDQAWLYPRGDSGRDVYHQRVKDYPTEDYYAVIGGNIYPFNGHDVSFYNGSDISVYDYLNGQSDIDEMITAYNRQRQFIGMIGALNANNFIWLCYMLGYIEKFANG